MLSLCLASITAQPVLRGVTATTSDVRQRGNRQASVLIAGNPLRTDSAVRYMPQRGLHTCEVFTISVRQRAAASVVVTSSWTQRPTAVYGAGSNSWIATADSNWPSWKPMVAPCVSAVASQSFGSSRSTTLPEVATPTPSRSAMATTTAGVVRCTSGSATTAIRLDTASCAPTAISALHADCRFPTTVSDPAPAG